VRKIKDRYIIGSEEDPLLIFVVKGGNQFEIRRLRSSGINGDIGVTERTMGGAGWVTLDSIFLGVPLDVGSVPAPIRDHFEETERSSRIRNALGQEVGYLQGKKIFSNAKTLVATVDANGDVRRTFQRYSGALVQEEPTGHLRHDAIWLYRGADHPAFPFPIPALQRVSHGLSNTWICISDFICVDGASTLVGQGAPWMAFD
jgi:hypothetical protein